MGVSKVTSGPVGNSWLRFRLVIQLLALGNRQLSLLFPHERPLSSSKHKDKRTAWALRLCAMPHDVAENKLILLRLHTSRDNFYQAFSPRVIPTANDDSCGRGLGTGLAQNCFADITNCQTITTTMNIFALSMPRMYKAQDLNFLAIKIAVSFK